MLSDRLSWRSRETVGEEPKLMISYVFGPPPNVMVPGDSNHDGKFNSADLVLIFQAGEYEDGIPGNSTWEEGDWNGDGEFDTGDLVFAFTAGTYGEAALVQKPVNLNVVSSAIHSSVVVSSQSRRALASRLRELDWTSSFKPHRPLDLPLENIDRLFEHVGREHVGREQFGREYWEDRFGETVTAE
jgi:hypothetical protein